jgi:glycosyltransferase involved in cell wall biosynthesis
LCLAYPSLYEGFGLPIIKSFKVGVPVITSNTSSMSEITKDAAILVNPESIDSIKKAIEKIIKSPELRKDLSKKGLSFSHQFSWQKTAQQTLRVYNSIIC